MMMKTTRFWVGFKLILERLLKIKRLDQLTVAGGIGLFSCVLLSGCSSPTYNVEVSLTPSMLTVNEVYPSLEVDVVALNQNETVRVNGYSTDEYFEPGNPFRDGLVKKTFFFSNEHCQPETLSDDDSIWNQWNEKGVDTLFVIGNLPGVWKIASGKLDGRRLTLPLDSDCWPNGDDISIKIKAGGLFLNTPMTPPGKK